MDKIKKEDYKSALIAYLIAIALLFLVPYTVIAAGVIPFVLVYAVVRCGYYLGGAVSVLSFATACAMNMALSCVLASVFLPVVVATAYVIKEKKRFRDSVAISTISALVGVVLGIGVLWIFTGLAPVDFVVAYVSNALQMFNDAEIKLLYQSARYVDILSGAVTQDVVNATDAAKAIVNMQDIIREWLNLMLVVMIAIYAMIAGLLCYLIPRAVVKKRGMDVIEIPEFSQFSLPKRFWLAYILSYLFAAIGASYGWQSFDILEITIYYVYGFVFVIQGLSFLDFLYKKRKMSTGVRVVLHALAVLILSGILVWVGLFESIMGMRKRMNTKGGTR